MAIEGSPLGSAYYPVLLEVMACRGFDVRLPAPSPQLRALVGLGTSRVLENVLPYRVGAAYFFTPKTDWGFKWLRH